MQYEPGKWLVICDRCGFKRMNDEVQKTWDNFMVCKPTIKMGCFETRHPLDFVRAVKEDTGVPFTRPQQPDLFVEVDYVDSSVGVQENTIPSGNSGNGTTL
jgi:hypothetical protein